MQKLYCYVDESGQDAGSTYFIVAAVVSHDDQATLREQLLAIERETMVGRRKWHKSHVSRSTSYLRTAIHRQICSGQIMIGQYTKPLPYFLPMLGTIEWAVKTVIDEQKYDLTVIVDGIDKKKAAELTNALRLKGITLRFVKGKRDESEPLLRFADRWAGCARSAIERSSNPAQQLWTEALALRYVHSMENK